MAKSKSNKEAPKTKSSSDASTDTAVQPKPAEKKKSFFDRRHKIVRIEPSPFAKLNLKIKMAQAKVNSAGYAVQDADGNLQTTDVDVDNAVQVPGTTKVLGARLGPSGLITGLNILIDNPYDDEITYHPEWGEKVLKGKPKALLQHILEYKHKKDYDYYTGNLINQVTSSDILHEKPFFLQPYSKVQLDGSVTFLNLDNPLHEVQYYMLRSHPLVANSYNDLDEGRNSDAIYYMVDEEEAHDHQLAKVRKETKAAAILEELNEKGDAIIKMALALGSTARALNAKNAFKYIHSYYQKGEQQYSQFMTYYKMYTDSARRDQFYAAAELQEFLNHNVFRVRDNKYYWVRPEVDGKPVEHFEWASRDKVIHDFILAPEYGEELDIARSIIKTRKNI